VKSLDEVGRHCLDVAMELARGGGLHAALLSACGDIIANTKINAYKKSNKSTIIAQ
jgi:hypothetical protein